jgi:hypothetical protein
MPVETPRHEEIKFEATDLNAKATFLTGVGVIAGTWIIISVIFFCFIAFKHYRAVVSPPRLPAEAHGAMRPPEPRLQSSPRLDLKAFRERENWELTHYHWVDKAQGIVGIPIEQAIQIVAARGIPPAKSAPNATLTPPQEGTRETGFEGKVEPEPR